jgi:hypothetical protein
MMTVRVQCPFCAKALKLRQAPVPGRRLLCNGCNRTFPVPADAASEPAPAPEPVPAGAAPAPDWALAAPKFTLPEPTPPPAVLPSSILIPVAPPPPAPMLTPAPSASSADAEAPDEDVPGPRRGLLVGGVAGALVLLVGSTVLAVALASRADRRRHHEPVALVNPPSPKNDNGPVNQQSFSQPRSVQPPHAEDDFSPPPRRNDDNPPLAGPRSGDRPPPRVNTPEPPPEVADVRTGLPRELQEQVNKAIDKGVEHLKAKQLANGSWEQGHPVGLAALPGLTLLECGVKADDPCVQKAAKLVRENVLKLTSHSTTYESSLALLFLDRLGDPRDKGLIRSIAMRLVAGQLPGGGWTYNLPVLTAQEDRQLLEFLNRTRPERDLDRMVGNKPDDRKLDSTVKKSGSLDAYYEAQEAKKNEKGSTKGFDREPTPKKDAVKPLSLAEAKKAAEKLPQRLRTVTAVTDAAAKPQPNNKLFGGGDNSNTQFAMLALWAARRHDLPLERSLDAVGKRFRDSQKTDGTWLYMTPPLGWGTPAMTGSGLLGLAVGHGSATDPDRRFKVKDEKINLGLKALGQHVGKPLGADPEVKKKNKKGKVIALKKPRSPINLYFLWTVERVGVLYDVREMDGKDWYLWGVEQLLPTQDNDGSWHQGNYPGSTRGVDTCFALLFLKRANLASDLTRRLDFVVEGKPGK